MLRLIIRRLIAGVMVVFTVATISFFLLRQAPGGPFDAERSLLPEVQRNIEERYHLLVVELSRRRELLDLPCCHIDIEKLVGILEHLAFHAETLQR